MSDASQRPQWAPRVRQSAIRRLYETDAKGLCDDELVDEVGYALFARCESMVEATEADQGTVTCPSCGRRIPRAEAGERVQCGGCGWAMDWSRYQRSMRKKKLVAPAALEALRTFVRDFPRCRSAREKTIAIDALLHTFHHQIRKWPTSPVAKNLIEGTVEEIVAFLDGLTYGQGSTPALLRTREAYRATLDRSWAGGARRPRDWREPVEDGGDG